MDIGAKIKKLRLKNSLTLEELANRCELTKGFLSQLERDKTTTSIQTLLDILEVLGTTPVEFFDDKNDREKIVFCEDDCFVQEDDDFTISWLVPNAQKNQMEPILITLKPNKLSNIVTPFEGEAFGYVLKGKSLLVYDDKEISIEEGNSFYVDGECEHYIKNNSSDDVEIIWVATPPIF
ncbi:transcriptional regulator with XRE-family HTH domain [Bacilli bacterium PM5-3]|nr:transcriptional regulator with XRE-family HTH domain [Bacilli bacterium PM5-3]MDH6603607.1 transcriptional regulator with XRE-family HTH domain [Bacilli bacterium PM5-9]